MVVILGIVSGVCLGIVGYYLDRKFLRMQLLGKVIVLKTIASLGIITVLITQVHYVIFDSVILASPYLHDIALRDNSCKYVLLLRLVYCFFMTLLISFINQVNKNMVRVSFCRYYSDGTERQRWKSGFLC